MNDSTCPRPCLMKLDLQSSTNKLAFLKDNWPSFGQIESIDRLSETELRCTLCLLDVVLAALAKDECFCPNREIIRLVLTRTYVQNRCELCETEEIRSKLIRSGGSRSPLSTRRAGSCLTAARHGICSKPGNAAIHTLRGIMPPRHP